MEGGVNPVSIVRAEINRIILVFRQNRSLIPSHEKGYPEEDRDESSYAVVSEAEHPRSSLYSGLLTVRQILAPASDLASVDLVLCLQPFLNIICSDEQVSVEILIAAFTAVIKFINYGFIQPELPSAQDAIQSIATSMMACHFLSDLERKRRKGTSRRDKEGEQLSESEEVVLMNILECFQACLACPAGLLLTDEAVTEIVHTCFRITRLSAALISSRLKWHSSHVLTSTISMVFKVLINEPQIETSFNGPKISGLLQEYSSSARSLMSPGGSTKTVRNSKSDLLEEEGLDEEYGFSTVASNVRPVPVSPSSAMSVRRFSSLEVVRRVKTRQSVVSNTAARSTAVAKPKRSFGLPCVAGLICFMCTLIQPSNHKHSRQLGLNLINLALETGGSMFSKFPILLELIRDDLCRYLLLSAHTADDVEILSRTLRAIFNLFLSLRNQLKIQFEVFVNEIYLNDAFSKRDQREIMLEGLIDLIKDGGQSLLMDLYINYDCDPQRSDMVENLCEFFSRCSIPSNEVFSATHLLSLEAMLTLLHALPAKSNQTQPQHRDSTPWKELIATKISKTKLRAAARYFNRSPKNIINFLISEKIVNSLDGTTPDPVGVARFLRFTPNLNKVYIGEFLGNREPLNGLIREAYFNTFDFRHHNIESALRMCLDSFRLPGEAQQIDRLVESFSKSFFERNGDQGVLVNADAAHTLSFSIIMLNTDLHSQQIRPENKMTLDQFVRNNRGINGGQDFPRELLETIYISIANNEFKMSEDVVANGDISSHRWKHIVSLSETDQGFHFVGEGIVLDEIYPLVVKHCISTFTIVFKTVGEVDLLQRTADGLCSCAMISGSLGATELLDSVVIAFAEQVLLASLAIQVGPAAGLLRSHKAQMSLVNISFLLESHGNLFRYAWKNVLDCVYSLFKNGLFDPPALNSSAASTSSSTVHNGSLQRGSDLHMLRRQPSVYLNKRNGVVSAEDVQLYKDFVQRCGLNNIFVNSFKLSDASLCFMIKSLLTSSIGSSDTLGITRRRTIDPSINTASSTFFQEHLAEVIQINFGRIHVIWPTLEEGWAASLRLLGQLNSCPTALLKSSVQNIFTVCHLTLNQPELSQNEAMQTILVQCAVLLRLIAADWASQINLNKYLTRFTTDLGHLDDKLYPNLKPIIDTWNNLLHDTTDSGLDPTLLAELEQQDALQSSGQAPRASRRSMMAMGLLLHDESSQQSAQVMRRTSKLLSTPKQPHIPVLNGSNGFSTAAFSASSSSSSLSSSALSSRRAPVSKLLSDIEQDGVTFQSVMSHLPSHARNVSDLQNEWRKLKLSRSEMDERRKSGDFQRLDRHNTLHGPKNFSFAPFPKYP